MNNPTQLVSLRARLRALTGGRVPVATAVGVTWGTAILPAEPGALTTLREAFSPGVTRRVVSVERVVAD